MQKKQINGPRLKQVLNALRVLRLMLREASLPAILVRVPEASAAMNSVESVNGFDREGARTLLPIYHFNALAISRLARHGAQIVDLGCGSGRFLSYLATRRPDLKIIGFDLAEEMIQLGRHHLFRTGLEKRVHLAHGDMRDFRRLLSVKADVVTSVFSMHHLETRSDLLACLREMAALVNSDQALVWIFDHVRPRRPCTASDVPQIFSAHASAAFRRDSINSLCASWSFEELERALDEVFDLPLAGARSSYLPLYQIHWTEPSSNANAGKAGWINDADLQCGDRLAARFLSRLFRPAPV